MCASVRLPVHLKNASLKGLALIDTIITNFVITTMSLNDLMYRTQTVQMYRTTSSTAFKMHGTNFKVGSDLNLLDSNL